MKAIETFTYKGRFACRLEDGRYMLSNGSMSMLLCEKVPEGYRVLKSGIIGGIMMKTMEDFLWCVEHCRDIKS